jgi:predicted enzyme related to lactoylglutathione lyase
MMRRSGRLVQFAIHARDQQKAASFYEAVFGWQSSPLRVDDGAPPDFVIENPSLAKLRGLIVKREKGSAITGFECIVGVESLETVESAIVANGGTILEGVAFTPGVGGHLRFADPDGNVVQAFQFARVESSMRGRATSNARMQRTSGTAAKRRPARR